MTQPARDEWTRPGTVPPPEFLGAPAQAGGVLAGWLVVIRGLTLGVDLDRGGARAAFVSLPGNGAGMTASRRPWWSGGR